MSTEQHVAPEQLGRVHFIGLGGAGLSAVAKPLPADHERLAAMAAASRAHGVRDADAVLARLILQEVPVER